MKTITLKFERNQPKGKLVLSQKFDERQLAKRRNGEFATRGGLRQYTNIGGPICEVEGCIEPSRAMYLDEEGRGFCVCPGCEKKICDPA